jgi:cyclic pyranopterin phosphate synthase
MTERDRQRLTLPLYGQHQDDDLSSVPTSGLLVDSYGRRIKNLRISVTDKCNFRCTYCMPAEGLPWLPKTEILSYEEITRIARVAVHLGIEQIRLTGGESLVRRNLPELVCQLRTIEGLEEIKHFR